MTRYALLLGSDDVYYVRKTSLITHYSGLTYKLKKKCLMAKLICFNAKRKVLKELRDNLQSSRPSLELVHTKITPLEIDKEDTETDQTRSTGKQADTKEYELDPCQFFNLTDHDKESENVFLGNVGINTFFNDLLDFDSQENIVNNDNELINSVISESQCCDSPEYNWETEQNAPNNAETNNNIEDAMDCDRDGCDVNDKNGANELQRSDSPEYTYETEQNVSSNAGDQQNRIENPLPENETSGSEYNPESDLDKMSDGVEEGQDENDDLIDGSLDPTIQRVDVSNDFDKSKEAGINDEFPFSVPGTSACKASDLKTELSRGPKGDKKKNVCLYCKKPQSKIARHLEFVHKNEEKVKIFASLPPNDPKRLRLIGLLRKKGNYMHLDKKNNTDGLLVPVRRPRDPNKSSGNYYAPCPKCFGMYTKNNLRHHVCGEDKKGTTKGILLEAKRVAAQVHELASVKMRRDILPRLAEDEVGNTAKFDKLIVLYGNDMATRYKRQYLESMVRSQLRLLSRFLITIKSLDKHITDLASVYDPKYYKKMIQAMEIMGQLDPTTSIFKTPAVAYNLQIVLRKVADVLIRESIQDHEDLVKKNAKDMLKLMNQGFVNTVNKTVTESQVELKRQKTVNLPKTADIRKLSEYLGSKMDESYKLLLNSFSFETWRNLAEITLIYIMTYNRKRPGELERMMKLDYNNIQEITENDEDYQHLSTEGKNAASKYVRVEIRGKLNRVVPVLLNQQMKKSVDLILNHAKNAGVASKNPYVFGIPSHDKNRFAFLRATILLRRFASECGASEPETLRGTNMRKHMATKCVNMNLKKKNTDKVAHFMGHNPDVHTNIYQQRKSTDILLMSKYLEKAQGRGSTSATDISQDCSTGPDTTADADTTNETGENDSEDSTDVDDAPNFEARSAVKERKSKPNEKKNKSARRATSGRRRSNTKKRWNPTEITTVQKHFKEYLESATLPSMTLIKAFQKTNSNLKERHPASIKVWLHNQIKKQRFSQ